MLIVKFEDNFSPLNETEKKYAPETINVQGDLELLRSGLKVAIIGSRNASPEGLARGRRLTKMLVEMGVIIVSGLAKGIDTIAHTTAIDAGGRTIAVLGTPLSQATPVQNRDLQNKIGREHLLISQFPEGKPAGKGNFPIRNRLMALISDASVVIEANDGSGTAHHGWEAIRLGHPLWIPKAVVEDTTLKWPKQFLEYGAQILSNESLSEFKNVFVNKNPKTLSLCQNQPNPQFVRSNT